MSVMTIHTTQGQFGPGPSLPPCPGELLGNLIVNSIDLAVLLNQWGPVSIAPSCSSIADFNSDGVVDSSDLAVLLANWGCAP